MLGSISRARATSMPAILEVIVAEILECFSSVVGSLANRPNSFQWETSARTLLRSSVDIDTVSLCPFSASCAADSSCCIASARTPNSLLSR